MDRVCVNGSQNICCIVCGIIITVTFWKNLYFFPTDFFPLVDFYFEIKRKPLKFCILTGILDVVVVHNTTSLRYVIDCDNADKSDKTILR